MLECIIILAVLGVIAWLITAYAPVAGVLPQPFRILILIVLFLAALMTFVRCLHLVGAGLSL